MSQAAHERSRKANPPGGEWLPRSLSIDISPGRLQAFINGYKEDPSFSRAWGAAEPEGLEVSAAQKFYKSPEGLLMFCDTDWVPRLCVPKSKVQCILGETHDSPWEMAHAGSSHLYHQLATQFYWPRMWADIVIFTQTCDICQKMKLDK
jgi:Integrase zinc binding domain